MKKNRYWTLVLYPRENEEEKRKLEHITKNYKYAMIEHDKDEVKTHTHIIWETPSPRTENSMKEELGIKYIEVVHTKKAMYEYLIHKNNKEKFQYSLEQVQGDLVILDDDDKESKEISTILKYLYSSNKKMSLQELNEFVYNNNLWGTYRRSAYIIIKSVEEFNYLYYNKEKEDKK